MLIKHLLEDGDKNKEEYNTLIERIANSEYFNEMYGKQLQTIEPEDLENESLVLEFTNMYRGSKVYDKPYYLIKPYSSGRKPSDTNKAIHDYVNMLAIGKFKVPVRDLIFADKEISLASEYGNPYVLFPLGDYRFFIGEKVRDFTSMYGTENNFLFSILNEVHMSNEGGYDEMIFDNISDSFNEDILNFDNQKKFDKSLKKLARKVATAYYNEIPSEVGYKQSDVKILEKEVYLESLEFFNQFESYINSIYATKSLHDFNKEEIMIHCDEIVAVDTREFTNMVKKILEIKKGSS